MKILIAGCGFAGIAIARRFIATGHQVWGLRRDPLRLPGDIRALGADLSDPASLRSIPADLDVIVYSASPDGSDPVAYERTYVGGVRNLLAEVRRRSPRLQRFLLTSSTGVYGHTDGRWIDETTPPEPGTARSETLLHGERVLLDAGVPAIVVRLGGLYGPGRRRLVDNVRAGKAECVSDSLQYTNRIHRDDVAGVICHLAQLAFPAKTYLAVDDEPAERCEVMRWLARRLGAPEPTTRPARDEDRAQSNKRCSNRLLTSSGYAFTFPTYREGYADVLAQLDN